MSFKSMQFMQQILPRETEVMDARGEVNGETLSQKYTYEWGNSLVKSVESAGGIKTHYGYSHIDDTLIGITTDDNGIEHTNRMGYTANLLTVLDNMSGICYNYKYDGFGRMTEAIINGTSHATFGYSKTTVNEENCDTEVMTLASGESFTTTEDAEGTYFQSKYNDTVIKQSNTFDESKRCTKYTEFPAQAKEKVHTFAYDSEGNVTEHTFGSCSAEYQYDKYNRTTKTDYWFTSTDGQSYTYKYKDGLKNELEEVSGFGLTQTFGHDKLERQTESKISNAGGTLYSKKATYLKYGDHSTDIVADLTYKILNGNADREKYSYDKEGNISAIHENGKLKVKYTYDALNRLIREDNRELSLTTVFEYDNGGNLIRQNEYAYSLAPTDELENENVFVYTYGNEGRSDQLTNFNGEAITYDTKGCPVTYRGNACTYTRGTLLAAYGNNTFDYDADGIRTKKNSTTFTYVDDKLIRQTGGGATIDFVYGASGVVGFKYNNNIYIYRRNLMGDVTHIYDTNGTLKAKYIYDAWGNHRIVTDVDGIATLNPIRYRGYYYDTETGLYYLKARYYDPETGRFISQDDMAYIVSEHLMGLNLYAYCNNNPVMCVDPSGHAVVAVTVAAFAKVVLIGAAVGAVSGIITSAITYSITADEFTWRGFGAAVAGGAVSGAISGGVSTACSILSPVGVVVGGAAGGFVGGFAGSLVESVILGEDLSKWETWKPIVSDTVWSAAGGALGGLVSGPAGSSAGAVATKFFKHPIKNALTDLCENLIMDFTTWYSKFVTEGVIESYS